MDTELDEMKQQINADERRLNDLSEEIIGATFEICFDTGLGDRC